MQSLDNLDQLTYQELIQLRSDTESKIRDIKTDIQNLRLLRQDNGKQADNSWLRRAKRALAYEQDKIRLISPALAKKHQERKEQNIMAANNIDRTFRNVARELLDRDVFMTILQEATERMAIQSK